MSTHESGRSEQAGQASATAPAVRASATGVLSRPHPRQEAQETDPMIKKAPTEHMIMDGFIWHSISCVCHSCVHNDNAFNVTFNRRDFRPT
jgi:hypothetical protein